MVVGRLQRDPDRRAAPAGAEGDPARSRRPRTSSRTTSTTSTASSTSTSTSSSMEVQPAITRFPDYPLDEKSLAERFDAPPWSLLYKKQQRDGPFWQASLFPARYDRIEVPVLDDRRLVRRLPRLDPAHAREAEGAGLGRSSGPGTTRAPTRADPGPRSSGAREAVRFFDQFLKGKDTGFSKQPRLAVYVRALPIRPERTARRSRASGATRRAGRSRRSKETTLHLTPDHALAPAAAPQRAAHALALRAVDRRGRRLLVGRADARTSARPTPGASSTTRGRCRRTSRSSDSRRPSCAAPPTRRWRTGSRGCPTSRPTARSRS